MMKRICMRILFPIVRRSVRTMTWLFALGLTFVKCTVVMLHPSGMAALLSVLMGWMLQERDGGIRV